MKIKSFEELDIWKLGIELVVDIYHITNLARFSRDFGLRDQIRRATVSIVSNIAEGFEMANNNDFIRFLRIAKGSVGEVRTQLYIALKLGYITDNEYQEISGKLEKLSPMIGKLTSYLLDKRRSSEFKTR